MSKIKPRAKIPKEAELDEVIEIKTLIRHPMHSGRVKDVDGKTIPRLIINKFKALFNGKGVEPLIADWTNEGPEIQTALNDLGKAAIPVNILYIPGQEEPVILPELLTVENVSKSFNQISN